MTPVHCAYCGTPVSGPDVLVSRSLCYCGAFCFESSGSRYRVMRAGDLVDWARATPAPSDAEATLMRLGVAFDLDEGKRSRLAWRTLGHSSPPDYFSEYKAAKCLCIDEDLLERLMVSKTFEKGLNHIDLSYLVGTPVHIAGLREQRERQNFFSRMPANIEALLDLLDEMPLPPAAIRDAWPALLEGEPIRVALNPMHLIARLAAESDTQESDVSKTEESGGALP